jgi:hypothetical protein
MKEKIRITIEGQELEANARKFSTGSEGYGLYGKINIGGETYQMSINIIRIKK